jgi:hypothetical protein
MKKDERNLPLSTDSAEAVTLFDRAVGAFASSVPTPWCWPAALAADPDFVMDTVSSRTSADRGNPANQAESMRRWRARAGAAAITTRERLIRRREAWQPRPLADSFAVGRQILDARPTDLLAFRICDTIWFRHGQTQPILEQADRVTPRWSADLPGYDCAQTIWAFAHEEVGDTRGAENAVDAALERDPTN